MKLLNVLGAVVVVHIAVLILAVAIPGCRTTSGASNSSVVAVDPTLMSPSTASSSPISSVPDLSDSDLNPPLADASSPTFDPNAPARSAASSSGRYSPTRPNSPVGSALTPAFLPESAPPVTPVTTYTVKGGDNLWTLAKKNNVSVRELASANDLAADSGLRVGQVLVIPGAVRPASPTAAPAVDPAKVITYDGQCHDFADRGETGERGFSACRRRGRKSDPHRPEVWRQNWRHRVGQQHQKPCADSPRTIPHDSRLGSADPNGPAQLDPGGRARPDHTGGRRRGP
jgi:LysM repeat protein